MTCLTRQYSIAAELLDFPAENLVDAPVTDVCSRDGTAPTSEHFNRPRASAEAEQSAWRSRSRARPLEFPGRRQSARCSADPFGRARLLALRVNRRERSGERRAPLPASLRSGPGGVHRQRRPLPEKIRRKREARQIAGAGSSTTSDDVGRHQGATAHRFFDALTERGQGLALFRSGNR